MIKKNNPKRPMDFRNQQPLGDHLCVDDLSV